MSEITYHLEVFDGPLDLLLTLISKQKINIYDIPIALISAGSAAEAFMTSAVAAFRDSHHEEGSCSAHPGLTAMIAASVLG